MKEMIRNFKESALYKKHEKLINKLFILFVIILVIVIAWFGFVKNLVRFYSMEKEMRKATETYYSRNLDLRPKEVGDISTVSLKKFQEIGLMEKMYIPGKNKVCSLDNSWGKIKKVNSGYEYYIYLECGRYHSSIDHEGPEITLNGKENITLEYNKEYKELGVKSVVDKKEGTLDVKKVQIVGKINQNKVGTYKIKYVAYDSLKNKTIKYRNVTVVKTLNYIAKQDNADGIYKGNVKNNYVWYSGNLWRIVRTNSDGSTKLITDDSLANISYSTGIKKDGYVYKWLNEYYYSLLYKPNKYIVSSKWCTDTTTNQSDTNTNCKNTITAKVGLITLSEYNQGSNNGNYLKNGMTFWTMTKTDDDHVYGIYDAQNMEVQNKTSYMGIRPTINIKSTISVSTGKGTELNPYILEGYESGKSGNLLNTRIAGEYIKYSGHIWRIQGFDDDKNTQIIMNGVLKNGSGESIEIGYGDSYSEKAKKFNVKDKDNIGYKLNHELKDYLITKKMVEGTYEVNFYKNGVIDKKAKNTKVTSLLTVPDMTEVFSLGMSNKGQNAFYIRNTIDSTGEILVVNASYQTRPFLNFVFKEASIKVVTRMDKNVKIKGGKGTYYSPYELR